MGRATLSPPKRESVKQARRRARYEALLDAVELATNIIATVSDSILSAPGLGSTAALVNQIVVVAKVRTSTTLCDTVLTFGAHLIGGQCKSQGL